MIARILPTPLALPDYDVAGGDPAFAGTTLTKICGATGTPTAIGGAWALDARQHYAKDQVWDDSQTLAWIEQKSTYPTKIILDALTWTPLVGNRGTTRVSKLLDSCSEVRWRPGYPGQMVGWVKTTQELIHFDPLTDVLHWRMHIPGDPSLGWLSEGTISDDGRWTVLATSMPTPQSSPGSTDYLIVVDMNDLQSGPPCDATMFTRAYPTTKGGVLGNVNISTRGNYVYGKLEGTPEYGFIWRVDKSTLTCVPQTMHVDGLRMFDAMGDREGWVACMSHADANELPDGTECIIGGVRDIESSNVATDADKKRLGSVITIDCETGLHTFIGPGTDHTNGVPVSGDQHSSGRAYKLRLAGKPAHLVTYASVRENAAHPDYALVDEIVLIPTDGSRNITRFGVTRTDDSYYRGEAHSCPSPDGSRVVYASNWMSNTPTPGSLTDIKAYCATEVPIVTTPPDAVPRYAVAKLSVDFAIVDSRGLIVHPDDLLRILNASPVPPTLTSHMERDLMSYPQVPYDPEKCGCFAHNMDQPFTVEAHGEHRIVFDCSYCGGFLQNYGMNILTDKRRIPEASLAVFDQNGVKIGVSGTPKNLVAIGTVPNGAIYTAVITGGGKREKLIIYAFGGI